MHALPLGLIDRFGALHPVAQAAIAGGVTWGLTLVGAMLVLVVRSIDRRVLDGMLGFAAGIMVAAACWSLLIPAISQGGTLPAVVGLGAGAAVLFALDRVLPHLHPQFEPTLGAEGPTVGWNRTVLLVSAITLHNVPEGLAIGVAFASGDTPAATLLAIGIGIQNVPEGLAVAMPLRREGLGRGRALWFGQLSAIVEPAAAALGAGLVLVVSALLPYALAFAAGAMLYVVVEELIPETDRGGNIDVATLAFIAGFALMMALDNAFG
jgi:ZIP family zinc transporter